MTSAQLNKLSTTVITSFFRECQHSSLPTRQNENHWGIASHSI